jgi:uncharacterized protein YndB with AHSA1/START domain
MRETLGSTDGRPTLRMERRLGHPAEKVWRALTDPKELSQWYPFRTDEVDLRIGGTIPFQDEGGNTYQAVITELEPLRVLGFRVAEPNTPGGREHDNRLRFELRDDGDGCLLIFTQVFADRPAAASYAAGWQTCLDAMENVLAGDPVPPMDPALMTERHEAFVAAFGLDRATVASGEARFERQLMMVDRDTAGAAMAGWPGRLTDGPGGARIELTCPADQQAAWHDRIESLAADLSPADPPGSANSRA